MTTLNGYFILIGVILVASCNGQTNNPEHLGSSEVNNYESEYKTNVSDLLKGVFETLKQEDSIKYFSYLFSKSDFVDLYIQSRGITDPNAKDKLMKDELVTSFWDSTSRESKSRFSRAIQKGVQKGITWSNISLDSTTVDSSENSMGKSYYYHLFFTSGNDHFVIGLGDILHINNKWAIGTLYAPNKNTIPYNIKKCEPHREKYISDCMKYWNRDPNVTRLLHQSVEDYCTSKFNLYSTWDNGEELILSNDFGQSFANKQAK